MSFGRTSFVPGSGVGVVGRRGVALIEGATAEIAEEVATQIDLGLDATLEVLAGFGLRRLGSFAVAVVEDDALRVLVRGDARVRAIGDRTTDIDGAGLRTWNEHALPDWSELTLALPDAAVTSTSEFWVVGGVVPASGLALRNEAEASRERPPLPEPASEPRSELDAAFEPDSDPAPAAVAEPELEPEPDPAPAAVAEPEPRPAPESDPEAEIAAAFDSVPQPSQVPGPSPYDEMYGHTVHRQVSDAAVHRAEDENAASTDPDGQDAPSAEMPTNLGDHDGHTISLAELRALQRSEAAGETLLPGAGFDEPDDMTISRSTLDSRTSSGAAVQAVLCDGGHPNPPQLSTCRICGASLGDSPSTMARPSLGRLTFSDGQVVDLDRPALLGRNPKVEGRVVGELPRVIRFEQCQGVSRNHAEVRLEGWQVLLVDLGSANHTTVTLPDRPPRRLRPDEPILLADGASIDLGGEVTATYGLHP